MINGIKLLALSSFLFIRISGSQLSAQGPYRCVFDFFSNCTSCTDLTDYPRNYCTSATIYAINCNDLSSGSYTFQWQYVYNMELVLWDNMPGATSNQLRLNQEPGIYRCLVTKFNGQTQVGQWYTGELFVNFAGVVPSITGGTSGTKYLCSENHIDLSVAASGSYLNYQWLESGNGGINWSDIPEATGLQYQLEADTSKDGNIYKCEVSNVCGKAAEEREILLNVYPIPEVSLGPDLHICTGKSYLLDPGPGYNSYKWNTGPLTRTLEVSDSGTYSVSISDANDCTNQDTVRVHLDPLLAPIILGEDLVRCRESSVILDAGAGFDHYYWSTGSVDQSIPVSETGTYWVTGGSDSSVCEASDTIRINISKPYQKESICLVTISLTSGKNMIVWEKTENAGIESYRIYRETNVRNVYEIIGQQSVDDLSIFIDATGKPENQSYLYKITSVDTCGSESMLDSSAYHKTILLSYASSSGGVNIEWSDYEIENGAVNFVTYEIWRGSDSIFLSKISEISSSSNKYNDTDPLALENLYYYRVVGVKDAPCFPAGSKKADEGYLKSFSNLEDNSGALPAAGISDQHGYRSLTAFPNPASDYSTIRFNNPEGKSHTLYLRDLEGKLQRMIQNISDSKVDLTVDGLHPGLYLIEINGSELFRGKLMVR